MRPVIIALAIVLAGTEASAQSIADALCNATAEPTRALCSEHHITRTFSGDLDGDGAEDQLVEYNQHIEVGWELRRCAVALRRGTTWQYYDLIPGEGELYCGGIVQTRRGARAIAVYMHRAGPPDTGDYRLSVSAWRHTAAGMVFVTGVAGGVHTLAELEEPAIVLRRTAVRVIDHRRRVTTLRVR